MDPSHGVKIPVILLKKNAQQDPYVERLGAVLDGALSSTCVPVFDFRFWREQMNIFKDIIRAYGFGNGCTGDFGKFGAMIFTSQRAVEAFSIIIAELRADLGTDAVDERLTRDILLYNVGPATAKALRELHLKCPVLGEETGNGDALSDFIINDYCNRARERGATASQPVMFLVGENRRDIVPKKLQAGKDMQYIRCDELTLYETVIRTSFKDDFAEMVARNNELFPKHQWVVVFSPAGCQAMLETVGMIGGTSQAGSTRFYIATIGPTTRNHLVKAFGIEPDVCAKVPSPDGIAAAIAAHEMAGHDQAFNESRDFS